MGCASGGMPQSSRTRPSSSRTSSRRSFASAARRRASTSATSPTGIRLNAVRRAIRGGIGSAGICEVTWSSMNRDAAHTRAVSTPCSIPSPVRASHRNSAATRFSDGGHRVRRGGDRLGTGPGRLDGHRERVPARPLAVEPDRDARRLGKPRDHLAARPRVERSRRVVEQHVIGPDLRQPARLLDDPLEVRHLAREREPRVQPPPGLADRGRRRGEVLDVVHGVVQAEDVDAALGRRQDEPPDQVVGDRPRADQEPAAKRDLKRRLRAAGAKAADPLPRALDAAPHGSVEAPAARDLEGGEARAVEDLRHLEHPGRRDRAREGLLREQPDRGVDDSGHAREM